MVSFLGCCRVGFWRTAVPMIGVALLLSGCASLYDSGPSKSVRIASQPSGLDFVVQDEEGTVHTSGVTPRRVALPRAAYGFAQPAHYAIGFYDQDGYLLGYEFVRSSPSTLFVTGNLFTYFIGYFVDASNGNMYILYPKEIIFVAPDREDESSEKERREEERS